MERTEHASHGQGSQEVSQILMAFSDCHVSTAGAGPSAISVSLHIRWWPEADIQEASIDVCVRWISGHFIREASFPLMTDGVEKGLVIFGEQ